MMKAAKRLVSLGLCVVLCLLSACALIEMPSDLSREEIILLPTKYQSVLEDAMDCMRTYAENICYVSTTGKSDVYMSADGEKNQLFMGVKEGESVCYLPCEDEALRRVMQLSGLQYIVADRESDTYEFCCNTAKEGKETVTGGLVYSKNVSSMLKHFGFPPTSITESERGFISYDETEVNHCYYEYIFGKYYYYEVTISE